MLVAAETGAADELPARPFVKPWYRAARTPGGLALEYGERVVAFEGRTARRLLPAMLPLLDGTRTVDELVEHAGEGSEPIVRGVLGLLARHGVLTDGPPAPRGAPASVAETASFLAAAFGAGAPGTVVDTLLRARLVVAGAGRIAAETARLLAVSGAPCVERMALRDEPNAHVALAIVAPAAAERSLLERWNEAALGAARPWLLALPYDGRYAAVGPLFVPGHTGCYECFRLRRLSGLEYEDEFWTLEQTAPPPRAPACLDAAAAALAATVALVFTAGSSLALAGGFHALEAGPVLGLGFHRLLRVPRCPACSGLADVAPPLPWFKAEALDAAA